VDDDYIIPPIPPPPMSAPNPSKKSKVHSMIYEPNLETDQSKTETILSLISVY
jgi:hypothetical protein